MPQHLVDIVTCAYNHESYIVQNIEGVLMQQTNFKFRLLIGEDSSTDNTKKILEQYAERHPDIIFPFYREKNVGAAINFELLIRACSGKYIALCEGDDYWTDPLKLQKQVDFLEAHPDYAICFHDVLTLSNNVFKKGDFKYYKEEADILDLAKGNFMSTLSVIFRVYKNVMPIYINDACIGDYILMMHTAKHGKIKYIDEIMGVYRVHDQGSWSSKNIEFKLIKTTEAILIQLNDNEFSKKVKKILRNTLVHYYDELLLMTGDNIYKKKISNINPTFLIKRNIKLCLYNFFFK